jgi:hypothetical protein
VIWIWNRKVRYKGNLRFKLLGSKSECIGSSGIESDRDLELKSDCKGS